MVRPLEFPDADDLVARYLSGVSLKQLAKERGVSRSPLRRLLISRGITPRNRSDGMKTRWIGERQTEDWRERLMQRAWQVADDRNLDTERKVLSLYREGLTSQAAIARRLGLAKPTVGGILRKNGIISDRRLLRRAHGIIGGFNPASQCLIEPQFASALTKLGLDYIHQHAIGTRNVDFAFTAERVAVEIVRRHWNDAKSLRRERLEQIFGAGWRLWIVYDPMQRGIAIERCCEHLIACLKLARSNPSAPGQYWMIDGQGQPIPATRLKLHDFAPIEHPVS